MVVKRVETKKLGKKKKYSSPTLNAGDSDEDVKIDQLILSKEPLDPEK